MTRSGEAIKALLDALDDAKAVAQKLDEDPSAKAGRFLDVLTAHIDDLHDAVAEEDRG